MAFAENHAAFFNTDEFATNGVLDGVAVRVIFDNAYQAGSVGAVGMASTGPSAYLPTSAVPADVEGKMLTINAVAYIVAEHQPDGTGVSLLFLERSA